MKAFNLIKEANSDEETKHLIDLRHKSQLDFNSITDEARQEGLQEGIQVGEQRGIQIGEKRGEKRGEGRGRIQALETVAFQMLSMNMPIDTIIAATGLEKSHIEELAKKVNRQ
ncbi:MAG: hypothetical protein H3C47_10615 [Candidatus Cloacimonetes bacterium]|nr:hypothetical protein [Candidatus Cloacimonadota bacterium]